MWVNWLLVILILGSFASILIGGLVYVGSGAAVRYRERVRVFGWRRPTLAALLGLLVVASLLLGFWIHVLALFLAFLLFAVPIWLHRRRSPAHVLLGERIEQPSFSSLASDDPRRAPLDEVQGARARLVRHRSMQVFVAGCIVFGLILLVILATRI